MSQDNICKTCRFYRQKIIVQMRHLKDIVNLYIKYNVTKRRKINEFAHSIL